MSELFELTATEIVASLARRHVSVQEVVGAAADRIAAIDPFIHAWAWLDPERAMEAARRLDAERARGECDRRLCGVPIGIKDIFNTADMPTEMGSRIWSGFRPGNDARAVFNLRYDGGVIMGKTTTSEFAVHEPTNTVNPRALDRAPGTSSSGSAAAVAAGMVPVALGSQTAGSTIRPASYCGVFGFKPSFGVVPRTGVLKTTDTLDTIGWFARSVDDVELLFESLRVHGPNYPFVNRALVRQALSTPVRLGVVFGPTWQDAAPDAQQAFLDLIGEMSRSGQFATEEVPAPFIAEVVESHEMVYCKALSYYFRVEHRNDRSKISTVLESMLRRGDEITPAQYHAEIERQASLTREVNERFIEDAWISLAAGGEAPIGLRAPDRPDTCKVWTYLGLPVMAVPAMKGASGLPIGCQIVGPKYSDYRVLDVARRVCDLRRVSVTVAELERRLLHD